ncbi:hypothetical protein PsorP6_006821 [Peronosclerospora sorghi]|uniref:Uncharacterized protein n=1 Tax=Peronosclerospora sorghi TaxID=230839 RepID=A0ACC0W7D6_9STRA|nr:hypothetical protein PsorP6_006821 [Peronosclerospora sorghi]
MTHGSRNSEKGAVDDLGSGNSKARKDKACNQYLDEMADVCSGKIGTALSTIEATDGMWLRKMQRRQIYKRTPRVCNVLGIRGLTEAAMERCEAARNFDGEVSIVTEKCGVSCAWSFNEWLAPTKLITGHKIRNNTRIARGLVLYWWT